MATEQLYHHPHFDHQECAFKSSPSLRCDASSFVQNLNNQACVLVAMGNFSKANDLFEIALTKHKKMVAGDDDDDDDDDDSVMMVNSYDDNDDSDSSFDYENDDFDYLMAMDTDSGNAIRCDPHHQLKNTPITPSNSTHASSSFEESLLSNPPSPTGFCRMRSCPQLQTFSYSGQETNRASSKWMYHQIYSMPIVMSETEWDNAKTQDRSFVLIFNSALCNHLLGMQLLRRQQLQSTQRLHQGYQTHATDPISYEDLFEVARTLYTLALEVFSSSASDQTSGPPFLGIDRLCYPAVFNNLSHVCKTLEGHNSFNAYKYDTFLLKSIFWLRNLDPTSSISSNGDGTSAAANVGESSTSTMTVQNSHNHIENDSYSDDDAEIIDAFLENVFYLIGAPSSVAPAPAA